MTDLAADGLRGLVAQAVREAVADMVTASVRAAVADGELPGVVGPAASSNGTLPQAAPLRPQVRRTSAREREETVRICDDADLHAFALHLLELFDNPKNRQDLRAGRYRFRLAASTLPQGLATAAATRRMERGAVTERHVKAAADAGERLVLGRGAVLTPLAREKARTLGVPVEKEQ